ncbi:golgin subfamily A member 3-like [Centruroides vittatus]|uniref:golgin subfamily A member 3-like n=1 Tax=Centruroides vittatus TaxID=120091 RepID=UPI00350F82A9
MAAIHLTIKQVSCQSEDISLEKDSINGLENLVNPELDFNLNQSMDGDLSEKLDENLDNSSLVNDIQPSSFNEKVPNVNTVTSKHSALSEGDFLYSYDSLNIAYPNISLPVAQYMTQHNPHIFESAANLLDKQDKNFKVEALNTFNYPPSPLKSMSKTSEALALQQSVIGKLPVKPVSPEIVAEIVEKTRRSSIPKTSSPHNFKDKIFPPNTKIQEKDNKLPINNLPVLYNELVKYPPESINAVVEKKSWFSSKTVMNGVNSTSSSDHSPAKSQEKSRNRKNSQSSRSSTSSKKGKCTEMVATHSKKNISEDVINQLEKERNNPQTKLQRKVMNTNYYSASEPDTLSFISDKCDTESTFSEVFDTESNISEISGLDEEMFRIKKLLIDVPNSSLISNEASSQTNLLNILDDKSEKEFLTEETQTMSDIRNQATETENDSELFKILREKAHLEGQLVTIKNEMDTILKEKTNLQKSLALFEAQLQMQTQETNLAVKEKEIASQQLERLQLECKQWDRVISEYQNRIEAKNLEIKALKEDLSETETTNEKLKITIEKMNIDLESKEGAVTGLKNKIAEFHVEVQMLLQNKVQLENDIKGIRSEMETLQKSKEWYQEQLYSVQESRNKVHRELISVQGNCVALSNVIEQLKDENNQVKQKIIETQQRAVKEKEVLMNHLENIEADMLERESLFQQIEKDQGNAEEILTERAKKVEEERIKLTNTMYKVSDLEHQVETLKQDLEERKHFTNSLEKNHSELMKQVTLLQKNIKEKDLAIQQWEQNYKSLEQKLKHAELELNSREEQIFALKSEKTAIEVSLAAANEEKKNVDDALKVVKDNLNRVETNFKQMRTELVSKSSQVEQLMKEKHHLEETFQKLEEQSWQQERTFEARSSTDNQNQEIIIDDLKKQIKDLKNIIEEVNKSQKEDKHNAQKICLDAEKENLNQQINNLQMSLEEEKKLNKILKKQYNSLQDKLDECLKDNSLLTNTKQKVSKENIVSSELFNNLKLSESLQDELKTACQEPEKQRMYKSIIKILIRKLNEKDKKKINTEKKKAVKQLKEISVQTFEEKYTSNEEHFPQDDYIQKIQELEHKINMLNEENGRLQEGNKINEELEFKIKRLEDEIASFKKLNKEQESEIEKNKCVILELEKEKGQLTGMNNSHDILRNQILDLEKQITSKEKTISYLEQQMQSIVQHREEEESKLKSRIEIMEKDLQKEKTLIKELLHQKFQEKRENSLLKRQITSLKSGLEKANQIADSRQNEIANINKELNIKYEMELKHRSDMECLQTQYRQKLSALEQLQKEVDEMKGRDPALAEQIKALSWHLNEKNQEIAMLKEQIKNKESRYSEEIKILTNKLQSVHDEIEVLKKELTSCRKEKFNYQAKVTHLQTALKSSIKQNEQLRTQMQTEGGSLLNLSLPDAPAPYDEKSIALLLQQSSVLPESRPLNNLQACLNSLKQEMAVLQKQLEDHGQVTNN